MKNQSDSKASEHSVHRLVRGFISSLEHQDELMRTLHWKIQSKLRPHNDWSTPEAEAILEEMRHIACARGFLFQSIWELRELADIYFANKQL